jgi:CheY-like chemotaxis protein
MKSVISELSVLVTDDSLTQRQYAKELCQDLGVKDLHDAANGVDALQVLESRGVDVVLIDLEMPIMDGVELIRSMAQKKFVSSVIILSAKDPILIASVGTMAEADGISKTTSARCARMQFVAFYSGCKKPGIRT